MNENLGDFLFNSFCVFIFITAISLFILINNSTNDNIKLVKNNLSQNKALYQSNIAPNKDIKVSGSEIINKIYDGLEVDIIVNSYPISKTVDKFNFNYDIIDFKSQYKVSYNMDSNGKVISIVYTKL